MNTLTRRGLILGGPAAALSSILPAQAEKKAIARFFIRMPTQMALDDIYNKYFSAHHHDVEWGYTESPYIKMPPFMNIRIYEYIESVDHGNGFNRPNTWGYFSTLNWDYPDWWGYVSTPETGLIFSNPIKEE